jgi:hypothetical protein
MSSRQSLEVVVTVVTTTGRGVFSRCTQSYRDRYLAEDGVVGGESGVVEEETIAG